MELKGAVVIVTGASSGIGAATARLAAGRGAKVVLAARRSDRIKDLANDLPDSLAVPTDLRDPAQVVEADVLDRHMEALAGVVDQDVHASEAIQGRVH